MQFPKVIVSAELQSGCRIQYVSLFNLHLGFCKACVDLGDALSGLLAFYDIAKMAIKSTSFDTGN